MTFTVNGREYEWGDLQLIIAGVNITGFRGIKHGPKQEKEALYAKGNNPLAIQSGNKSYEGELILTQSAAMALEAAAKGDLLDVRNATIVLAYGDPSTGMPPYQKTLTGISFTENVTDWKQGQKFLEKTVPFLYLNEK